MTTMDDQPDTRWMRFALCRVLATPDFDCVGEPARAARLAPACGGCVVQVDCFTYGRQEGLTGLWGGTYLDRGRLPAEVPVPKPRPERGRARVHAGRRGRSAPQVY